MTTKHTSKLTQALTFGLLLAPALAQAHPGAHHVTGFTSGLAHPMTGLDHLLAMVAVGLWAVQLGGRATWLVPSAFAGVMTLGAFAGMSGLVLPGVEQGIMLSVLVLGVLVAAAVRLPMVAGAALVSVFALFHGMAHGMEMPENAGGFSYVAGFLAATIALHLAGMALGFAARQNAALRVSGAAIAVSAVLLAFGIL